MAIALLKTRCASAAPLKFDRIVGPRLGLLGIYRDGEISATEFSLVKFGLLGDGGDRCDRDLPRHREDCRLTKA